MSEPGSGSGRDSSEGDLIRASDAEREVVVGRLNDAVGEGRLSLEEFSQRVAQAHAARTRGELDRLVSDLPMPGAVLDVPPTAPTSGRTGVPTSATPDRVQWHIAPIGGFDRRGRWRVRRRAVSVTLVGGRSIRLDEAAGLGAPTLRLRTYSVIGGVSVRSTRRPATDQL